jgi:histidine triad (HIT) family protein
MASVFTKIINGEIPSYKVAENESCYAFLDIAPLKKGHVLVVPKKEVDNIFDLDEESFLQLHLFSKKVALAIKKAIPCIRVTSHVIGLEVPHAHIHLIPIQTMNDCNFANPKLQMSKDEFLTTASAIANFINPVVY